MGIKIFHTGDVHIGMRFNKYPEEISKMLREARIDVIENMIDMANKSSCNIFVIAGDLFDKTTGIDKKTIATVAKHLNKFTGNCIGLLPGNHDFENEMVDLWKTFNNLVDDKLIFLQEERPYSLKDYGLDATIYPAPCHSKHSEVNNLAWIAGEEIDDTIINIGIAHGSLTGISPDLDNMYFNMDLKELEVIPVDVWLLGHSHIVYPDVLSIDNWKVHNPGTPEPDGMDCKHNGNAWIIDIDKDKNIKSKLVETGKYRFADENYTLSSIEDYSRIYNLISKHPENIIARIGVSGIVDEDAYKHRQKVFKEIEEKILYLIFEDSDLKIRINKEKIEKEFTQDSFPEQFLFALQEDEEALQMAYEMIMEVKNDN
ncbi:MAG: metallophosphoesterase [Gudongella sp.]|nr:metallophosphoesterase [Gudongella sp.]